MSSRGLVSSVAILGLVVLVAGCGNDNSQPTTTVRRPAGRATKPSPSGGPPSCPTAATGTVLSRTFTSSATAGAEHIRIYLPPKFEETAAGTVPLIVLLHGDAADETQWIDVGIAGAADCLIGSGEIPPTAIVTLDGSRVATERGSNPPMERLVVDEALPYLRAKYPSLAGPAHTSIGGISRGGDWALQIAADRPGTFAAVGGHSPAPELELDQVRALASQNIRVWLDAGKEDPFLPDVYELAASLRSIGFGSMVTTWEGGHNRDYWSQHVEDYLRFYAGVW